MTLNLTIRIEDIDGVEKAQELLGLYKKHWYQAEETVMAKHAAASATPAADTAQPLTLEDARAALESLVDKIGMSDGLEILKSFGAEKLSDLPQGRYDAFMTVCQEAAA